MINLKLKVPDNNREDRTEGGGTMKIMVFLNIIEEYSAIFHYKVKYSIYLKLFYGLIKKYFIDLFEFNR